MIFKTPTKISKVFHGKPSKQEKANTRRGPKVEIL
jgi:hypothetical protein